MILFISHILHLPFPTSTTARTTKAWLTPSTFAVTRGQPLSGTTGRGRFGDSGDAGDPESFASIDYGWWCPQSIAFSWFT